MGKTIYQKITDEQYSKFIDYMKENDLIEPKTFSTMVKWKLKDGSFDGTTVRTTMKPDGNGFIFVKTINVEYLDKFNEILESIPE